MRSTWTAERVGDALAVLGKSTTLEAALAGLGVTEKALSRALEARGYRAPRTYLGTAPQPALERAAARPAPVRAAGTPRRPVEPRPAPQPREPEHLLAARERDQERARHRAEVDSLLDQLQAANDRARIMDELRAPSVPVIMRREKTSGLREGALVVGASDLHVEERVDPQGIAGVNEYNLEIADRRIARLFDGIEWLLDFHRERFAIRDLIFWIGGDTFTGHIHEECVETAQLSPVESTLWVKRRLSTGIRRILKKRDIRVTVPCSYGNHGRTTPNRRVSTGAKNSFEWLMYQVLIDEFADEERVTFTADQSAHQYVEAFGRRLHFHHGDETRFNGGVGGLSIPLGKRVPQWDRVLPSDYHHIGHYHQFLDLGRTIVNGSLIGYNAYAMSIGASPEPPQQFSYVLDAKRGKTLVAPIWVGDEPEEPASRMVAALKCAA